MFRLKMKKSAGIPVTGAVHRLIVRANKARDRRDWPQAAEAYAKAVQADPILAHIWIQLGHALREHRQRAAADDAYRRAVNLRPDDPDLAPIWIQVAHSFKEQGQFAEAADAYRRAASLRPDDPDPHLYLGHLASRAGEHTAAGRHYLASFQADPGHADVAQALHGAIKLARGHIRQQFLGAIRSTLSNSPSPPIALKPDIVASSSGELSLTFDASDLILYFAHNRVPTGIQRVQIHAITGALRTTTASAAKAREVHVCCIIKGRDGWLEIPGASFLALVDLSQRSSDQTEPAWIIALDRLHLDLALAPEFVFPHGSCLVNLGASWQLHNYFLYVRAAKAKYAIRYIPFIHDLIPILAPQHFARGARLEVVPWLIGVLTHSDHFLANSQSTRRDLIAAAAIIGHTLDPANVAVIPLDADSRTPTQDLPTTALERWDVEEGQFALLVSTVESRKGHITAFEAWRALITRHGVAKLPKLLCVGKRGWLCDEVYERLEQDPALAAHVIMLSGLTDDEVALLYRTCLFTVYPSLYEGWGLPITEALCWSKPVIASDTSSLPEAGTSFAVYVEPGSISALAAAVERMTFDAAWRDGITARIKDGFKPRNWTDIALQIETELTRFAAGRMTSKPIPVSNATLGAYHPLGRGTARRIWPGASNGEAFRVGVGWRAPGFDASWTRPQGGELAIGLASARPNQPLRVGLLLIGSQRLDTAWQLQVRSGASLSGILAGGARRWVTFTHTPAPEALPILHLRIRAEPVDPDPTRHDDDDASIGVAGYFLYAADDGGFELRLLKAIILGELDELDAYRDPAPTDAEPDPWLDAWTADASSSGSRKDATVWPASSPADVSGPGWSRAIATAAPPED